MAVRIGEYVRRRRTQLYPDQSARWFARHTGVDNSVLSRVETGVVEVGHPRNLHKIAVGLGHDSVEALLAEVDRLTPDDLARQDGRATFEEFLSSPICADSLAVHLDADPFLRPEQRLVLAETAGTWLAGGGPCVLSPSQRRALVNIYRSWTS